MHAKKAGYAQQVVGSLAPDGRLKFLSAIERSDTRMGTRSFIRDLSGAWRKRFRNSRRDHSVASGGLHRMENYRRDQYEGRFVGRRESRQHGRVLVELCSACKKPFG